MTICWLKTGVGLCMLAGCASGEPPWTGPTPYPISGDPSVSPSDSGDSGDDTFGQTTGMDEGPSGGEDAPSLPDFGSCSADADCVQTQVACLQAQGHCEGGSCIYEPEPADLPCDDLNNCTEGDVCDGAGFCQGIPMDCAPPNTEGGSCHDGACQGIECAAGWGDCNGDLGEVQTDGCEVPLITLDDCSGCGQPCEAAEHATASCDSGTCTQTCDSPWDNCDGDWTNGCEIPVGVPNQCDLNGLNATTGCWTAYCGQSTADDAVNFDSFFCMDCSNCHVPGVGQCQWCDHNSGQWFPADTCGCGPSEDVVCEA